MCCCMSFAGCCCCCSLISTERCFNLRADWPLPISLVFQLLLCHNACLQSVMKLQLSRFPCSIWMSSQNVLERIQPLTHVQNKPGSSPLLEFLFLKASLHFISIQLLKGGYWCGNRQSSFLSSIWFWPQQEDSLPLLNSPFSVCCSVVCFGVKKGQSGVTFPAVTAH